MLRSLLSLLFMCCLFSVAQADFIIQGGNIVNTQNSGNINYDTDNDGVMDLVMDENANLGIGTFAPSTNLHVLGNVTIVDGNQAANRVLASDANGVGTWTDLNSLGLAWTLSSGNAYRTDEYIGIGTSSPSAKLHVLLAGAGNIGQIIQGAASQTANLLEIQNSGGTATAHITSQGIIAADAGSAAAPGFTFTGNTDTGIFNPSGGELAISVDGTQQATVSTSGNLGLGVSSPSARLEVAEGGSSLNDYSAMFRSSASVGGAGGVVFAQTGRAYGVKLYGTSLNNTTGKLNFDLVTISDGTVNTSSMLSISSTGLVAKSDHEIQAGDLVSTSQGDFTVSSQGSISMDIDSNDNSSNALFKITKDNKAATLIAMGEEGNVGIGTATAQGNLHVLGNIIFEGNMLPSTNTTYDIGSLDKATRHIYTSNLTLISDRRYKNNIAPLKPGLSAVMALAPVSYKFNHSNDENQYGLIAQDTERVLPDLVSKANDAKGTMGIKYVNLIPVLVNAIQEQQRYFIDKLESQEKRLRDLESRLKK